MTRRSPRRSSPSRTRAAADEVGLDRPDEARRAWTSNRMTGSSSTRPAVSAASRNASLGGRLEGDLGGSRLVDARRRRASRARRPWGASPCRPARRSAPPSLDRRGGTARRRARPGRRPRTRRPAPRRAAARRAARTVADCGLPPISRSKTRAVSPAPVDGLAVGDARRADVGLDAEVALEAVLQHLEVQLPHPRDDRLAGLLVRRACGRSGPRARAARAPRSGGRGRRSSAARSPSR